MLSIVIPGGVAVERDSQSSAVSSGSALQEPKVSWESDKESHSGQAAKSQDDIAIEGQSCSRGSSRKDSEEAASTQNGRRSLLRLMTANSAGFGQKKRGSQQGFAGTLLRGFNSVRSSVQSADSENGFDADSSANSEDDAGVDDDVNYSIFQEEGTPPDSIPLIRFLSPLAILLDRLRMLFALWSLILAPIVLAFRDTLQEFSCHPMTVALDYTGDAIFMIGVLAAFVTTVGNSSLGQEYLSLRDIFWHRMYSIGFWCDILSIGPCVSEALAGMSQRPWTGPLHQVQVLKLFRIHWIVLMPASHFETRFWSRLQILRMLAWIALCIHLIACLWYAVILGSGTLDVHLEQVQEVTAATHYFLAFKYGCYIVTGKPVMAVSDDELVLIAVSFPFGGLFFAFIYGNTNMLLNRMNIRLNKHHKHIAMIHRTLSNLKIPSELKQRVAKYHNFLAVHHNTSAYTSLMQGLSVNLFVELRANLFSNLFTQGSFFEGAPASFLRQLLQALAEVTFGPGDVVIRCGDIGGEMYFVVKGRLEVLNPFNVVVGQISENQYFGEIAMMVSCPRKVSIRTVTYCLLAVVSRDAFMPLLDAHPELKARMFDSISSYKPIDNEETELENIEETSEKSEASSSSSESSCEDKPSKLVERVQQGTEKILKAARRRMSRMSVISQPSEEGPPRRMKSVSFAMAGQRKEPSLPNLLVPKARRGSVASSSSGLSHRTSCSSSDTSRRTSRILPSASDATFRRRSRALSILPLGPVAQGIRLHGISALRNLDNPAVEEPSRHCERTEAILARMDEMDAQVTKRIEKVESALELLIEKVGSQNLTVA